MALDNPVYDLDFETKSLPSGASYTRSGYAWRVDGNKLRQVPPDMPLWGPKGLIIEDAGTNYVTNCTPQNTSVLSNASSYDFPPASGMRLEAPSMAHAGKGLLAAVRQAVDPLPDAPLGRLTCIWAYVEPITAVYVDLGFLDDNSNWTNRVRYSYDDRRVSVIPSSSPDVQPLYYLVSSRGRNDFPIVQIGAMASSGATDRYIGIAPTGDYPNRLKAVLHHLQCENIPGPSSPIVTASGTGTRGRATLIGTLTGTVFPLTVRIQAVAPVWMGQNQVLWQLDNDSDTGSVAVQRDAAGDLKVVCGGTSVSLGSVYNGETFAVALSINGSTLLASRDGQATVSATVSPGSVTKERWGHGYASGNAFYGQLARVQRWLAAASSSAVRAMSVDQASPVLTGDTVNTLPPATYAAGFDLARIPSILLESATVPSSGNARLLPVYAGELSAGVSKLVYRKAKADEISYAKGTRWENMTGAAYVDQDTLSIGGSNVTAVGNATHLGLPCNYITWSAGVHTGGATSTVSDNHGISGVVGQQFLARIDLSVSRPLVSDETINLNIWTSSGAGPSKRIISAADDIQSGTFYAIMIDEYAYINQAASLTLFYEIAGTFSSPLTIYVRRRMLFDASGLDASECVPDFVDPAVVYNAVAAGVKWLPTKCGNTVAANGVIIPSTGAALPEPMGVQWQPAATGLAANSPPTSGTNVTVTNATAAVAGLPAKRLTAGGTNSTHYATAIILPTPHTGAVSAYVVVKKNGLARPHLFISNGSWANYCRPDASWSAMEIISGTAHGEVATLTNLGGDDYLIRFNATFAGETGGSSSLYIAKENNTQSYAGTTEVLDVAAFDVVAQAYAGTPMLASGGATSRIADDSATGLPAIGTGAFTAFVDVTVNVFALGTYSLLFSSSHNGSNPVTLYISDTGAVYMYKDGVTYVDGTCSVIAGTRARFVYRRDAAGVVSLFKDGALEISVASTAPNSVNPPIFGSGLPDLECDMTMHANRLYYTALSDAQCIAVTTL